MTSEIIHHPCGSTTFSGPDAVEFFRALTLRTHLRLWASTKITPTRGVGITKMLNLATHYSGKRYKRTEVERAIADLTIWIETMRSALPCREV